LTGTRDATGRVSLGLLVESLVGQSPDEVRFPAADKLTDKWVAKRPLKGTSYFRYPSRDLRTRRLPWTVGDRATLSSQAWLIYLAKDVPKKHDIPFAIYHRSQQIRSLKNVGGYCLLLRALEILRSTIQGPAVGTVVHRLLGGDRSQRVQNHPCLTSRTTHIKMGLQYSPAVCFSQHLDRDAPRLEPFRVLNHDERHRGHASKRACHPSLKACFYKSATHPHGHAVHTTVAMDAATDSYSITALNPMFGHVKLVSKSSCFLPPSETGLESCFRKAG
jgi:hypothetical protein